jgi:hypothetical protein
MLNGRRSSGWDNSSIHARTRLVPLLYLKSTVQGELAKYFFEPPYFSLNLQTTFSNLIQTAGTRELQRNKPVP